jgi:hypothetical protein
LADGLSPHRRPVLLLGRFRGVGTLPVFGELDEYGEFVRVSIDYVGPDDGDGDP